MDRRVRAYAGELDFQRGDGATASPEGSKQSGLSRGCDCKRLEPFAACLLHLYRDDVPVFRKPWRGGLKRSGWSLTELCETRKRLCDRNCRFPAYENACPRFD